MSLYDYLKEKNENLRKVQAIVIKCMRVEISNLTDSCYYPVMKKYAFEILYTLGLTEKDMISFTKGYWENMPEKDWRLHNDHLSLMYIDLMRYSLEIKNKNLYKSLMIMYMLRQYTNLMSRQIEFCQIPYFDMAFEKISSLHLFRSRKSIVGAILHLAQEMEGRYTRYFEKWDLKKISKFIQESRTRISRSIKSFAEKYYELHSRGIGFKTPYNDDEQREKFSYEEMNYQVAEDVAKEICVYKQFDQNVLHSVLKLSNISNKTIMIIVHEIMQNKYYENIKLLCETFLRTYPNLKNLCRMYFKYVDIELSKRKTSTGVIPKYYLLLIIKEMSNNRELSKNISNKSKQFLYNYYYTIMHCIMLSLKQKICGKLH